MSRRKAPAKDTNPPQDILEKLPEVSVPISFVRGALFSVAKDGPKVEKKLIATEEDPLGIEIYYSGPHLNQDHFKAWQAIIYLHKTKFGGSYQFAVPATDVLQLMGKGYRDHDQRLRLRRLLDDLEDAKVILRSYRSFWRSDLLDGVGRNDENGYVAVRINPALTSLLTDETLENDILRMVSLGRDQLAMWLHNYFASWGEYRNVSVKDLHEMCGTKLDLKRFRYRLDKALKKLQGGMRPFITEAEIGDDDVVYVKKKRTKVKLLSDKDREAAGLAPKRKKDAAADRAAASRTRVAL